MTDILIVGGGTGGVAAALAACRMGCRVTLTEESDWVGGQLTSQAVPPDEHPWIERMGCTASYREFRNRCRAFYGRNYPLSDAGKVYYCHDRYHESRFLSEPRIAYLVLEEMLSPYISKGILTILRKTVPVYARRDGPRITAVELRCLITGRSYPVEAKVVLDATEQGDLLELAAIPYTTGSEGRDQYGELHDACSHPRPGNIQAVTWVAALGYDPGTPESCDDYRIEKPASYDFWRDHLPVLNPPWPGSLLNWAYSQPRTLLPIEGSIFNPAAEIDLWRYRIVLASEAFQESQRWREVTMLNWPQNDYFKHDLIFCTEDERAERGREARGLTLSLVYWLQNHAPRGDGGEGYAGIHLRPDATGTDDGLAQTPYIREARRLLARRVVVEGDLGVVIREGRRPDLERTSVGTGYYRIDLHPTTEGDNYVDIESFPFQIPLGALLAPGVENFIPAGKNIGMSHITNGCLRLHPVEWNIGEAAGALAAYTLGRSLRDVNSVLDDEKELRDYQALLVRLGVELTWPEAVYEEHARWYEVQPPTPDARCAIAPPPLPAF